ncbi:MAG: sugar ABC transporter permease [Chloroflexi bacterium]|nr:sugar ABC transporter permease [Chloroflexota bacterium]
MAFIRQRSLAQKEAILGWLLVFPWLAGFVLLIAGPIIASLVLSLTAWDILRPPKFIGLTNFHDLLQPGSHFWQSIKVTTIYAFVSVPAHTVLALLVAILLNQKVKGLRLWRTLYYLPSVVSGVAVAFLWQWVYDADFGLANWVLWTLFHIEGPAWLVDPHWALPALIIMDIWTFGAPMVIFLASLQGVPEELHEAAQIDGAGAVRRFFSVTLPLITPVVLFNVTLGLIAALQMFTQAYIITNGGPGNATLTTMLYLYQNAFQNLRMGYASAIAWLLFLYIMALTLLVFWSSRHWVYYQSSTDRKGEQ